MARVRLTKDGTFRQHDYVPPRKQPCPGSHCTLEEAKAAKSEGPPYELSSGRPDKIEPEDIF